MCGDSFSFFLSFFLSLFWPHRTACGISVPRPGVEPRPRQWKHQVLTTGPPGKSHGADSYSWNASLGAMLRERNTSSQGIQKYQSLRDTQAFSPPSGQCSQPEWGSVVMSSSAHVRDWKEGSLGVPRVLSSWWQFDLPSQISRPPYESECPTLSPITDSKEGLRTRRAQVFSLSDAFKAAS